MNQPQTEPAPEQTWLVIWWLIAFLTVIAFTLLSYASGFFFTPR